MGVVGIIGILAGVIVWGAVEGVWLVGWGVGVRFRVVRVCMVKWDIEQMERGWP